MIAGIVTGAFALLWILFCSVVGLACFAFWLWMLIHAIGNKGLTDGEKVAWVLVVIFLPVLGSILYFLMGREKGA